MEDILEIRLKSLCNCVNSINLTIRELSGLTIYNKIEFSENNFNDLQQTIFYLSDSIHNIGYAFYNIDNNESIECMRNELLSVIERLDYYKSRNIFETERYRFLLLKIIDNILEDIDELNLTL